MSISSTPPATTPLTVVAILYAQPGKEAALAACLHGLVAPSRAEAGCINYDMHQSDTDPTVFIMYENWTSRAALDLHFTMPYMRALADVIPALIRQPTEMHYLTMRSAPAPLTI
jgi:quinol monooxygenase YgiN